MFGAYAVPCLLDYNHILNVLFTHIIISLVITGLKIHKQIWCLISYVKDYAQDKYKRSTKSIKEALKNKRTKFETFAKHQNLGCIKCYFTGLRISKFLYFFIF